MYDKRVLSFHSEMSGKFDRHFCSLRLRIRNMHKFSIKKEGVSPRIGSWLKVSVVSWSQTKHTSWEIGTLICLTCGCEMILWRPRDNEVTRIGEE